MESAHTHLITKLLQVKHDVQEQLNKELKHKVRKWLRLWEEAHLDHFRSIFGELVAFFYKGANNWRCNKKGENDKTED